MAFAPTYDYMVKAFEDAAIGMQAAYRFCPHAGHHAREDTLAMRRYRLVQCFSEWLEGEQHAALMQMIGMINDTQEKLDGFRWLRRMGAE